MTALWDCIERDSPRDQLVVTLFLLTVFGLLLGAGIKGKMEKAGLEPRFNWTAGRELWEVRWRVRSSFLCLRLMFVDETGTYTTQTFGRVWTWGAESVRTWSAGRVQRSARVVPTLMLEIVWRAVTRIIYFITISVKDIKST